MTVQDHDLNSKNGQKVLCNLSKDIFELLINCSYAVMKIIDKLNKN